MAQFDRSMARGAALAAALILGPAGAALAQDGSQPHASPAWDTLVHCADLPNDDDQLACFRSAMRASGYAPKPETVAAVTTERHRRFGLALPKIALPKKHQAGGGAAVVAEGAGAGPAAAQPAAPQEDESHVVVTLDQVVIVPPLNKLLFITTEGAVWAQIDQEVISPEPHKGQKMEIRRGKISGFFCAFDKRNAARCERVR